MPVDLQTLFQSDPAAQELGLKMIGDQRAQDAASLEEATLRNQKTRQMMPHDIRGADLKNQIDAARLPQMFATTKAQELDNQFSEGTLGPRIKSELDKIRASGNKQRLEEITNAGRAYSQAGEFLEMMPGVATHAYAKQVLGNYYHPSFDQIPANALGGAIRAFGKAMVGAEAPYVQKQALADTAAAGKTAAEEEKTRRATQLAAYKNELAMKLAQYKEQAKKSQDPKTARALANQLFLAAQKEEDPDRKAMLMEQAESFNEIAFAEIERRAQATASGKPDLGKLGIETNPMPPTPTLPGAAPQQPQGGAQKPASLADVQKMYPGVPADKLKEAYKRKFGVDLQ